MGNDTFARSVLTSEDYIEKTHEILRNFNPTYDPSDLAVVTYKVCKPTKIGEESRYENGCYSKTAKEGWEVIVKVNLPEEKSVNKAVEFNGELPYSILSATVYGYW